MPCPCYLLLKRRGVRCRLHHSLAVGDTLILSVPAGTAHGQGSKKDTGDVSINIGADRAMG